MQDAHATFTLVLALAAGVLAMSVSRRVRVPGIVVLLAVGAGLGPDGLGWVRPRSLGDGLFAIVDLAVAVILFEGGLNLEISRLRRAQAAIRRLITWGALVSLIGGSLAARWVLGWDWALAALFGSLIVVTGPTVVGPLVSDLRLRSRVATVLNAEGVLIDPIGAILAVIVLDLVLSPDPGNLSNSAFYFFARLGFGATAGVLGGLLLGWLLRVRDILPEGHQNIFVLAAVLLLFQGCEEVISHSGILAVTLAGVVVGNRPILTDRDLREFKDQLSILLIGLLFVLLAADVRFDHVMQLGWAGVAVVAVLVFLVRPLGVWLSTLGSDLTVRERLFVGWIAPRGIVAAAVASLVAGALELEGFDGGIELRALVFLTIACTVVQAGLSAGWVGSWLGVRLPGRDTVVVLGAEGVGLALAKELRDAGHTVVILDANPQVCRVAEEEGFTVIFGNAMEERTLRRARFELVGTTVALTPNQTVNSAFVSRTRELFRVPEAYVAVSRLDSGLASELVERQEAHVAFDGPHDVGRWNVRFRRDAVELQKWIYRPPEQTEADATQPPTPGERFLILTMCRGQECLPMSSDLGLREGDQVTVAVHIPDKEEAERTLEQLGYQRVVEEPVSLEENACG